MHRSREHKCWNTQKEIHKSFLKYHIPMYIFLIFLLFSPPKHHSAPDSVPLHPIPPHSAPYIFPRTQGCREMRHPSTFPQEKLSIFNYFPYFS